MRRVIRLFMLVTSLVPLLFLGTTCSKSPTDDDDVDEDTTSPEIVSNLHVVQSTSYTLTLEWTAPHDYKNDHSAGFVDEYDLRVSYDSITTANFAQAYRIDSCGSPAPAGAAQQCVIEELDPDSTYYFAMKSRDNSGNWSLLSNCCQGHCQAIEVVVFADTALERDIREQIHKPTGEIFSSDVDTILYVDAPLKGIVSLVGLEYCTSMLGANLWGNEITDLTPLASTTQVWGLSLGGNNITDLSPLAGLPYLRQLHIGEDPVTDIGPLASIAGLQQLFMNGTLVTDFSPLYGLQNLDDIHLASLNLSDISFISNLTHLRICKLNSNNISSVAPLSTLTSLEGLDLMYNNITDVGLLSSLVKLNTLNLDYNNVADIQGLVDNSGLGTGDLVYLGANPLSQHAVDVQIPALQARGVTVYH